MSWLLGSTRNLLEAVGEVVAPSVKSNFEKFKNDWNAVRNFYIDEQSVDPESYQEEGIPNHLVSMIQILIDEERETKEEHFQHRNGQQTNANMPVSSPSKFNTVDHYQPCLEFFVQKKIMETLCMIAQKDTPKGSRKLILQLVSQLFTDMPQSLLPIKSVNQPLISLIRHFSKSEVGDKSEYVEMLVSLLRHLRQHSQFVGLFCTYHEHPTTKRKYLDFLLFSSLLPHLKDEGYIGNRAKEGMLLTCQFQKLDEIIDFIENHSGLTDRLLEVLIASFKLLPLNVVKINANLPVWFSFRSHFKFANDILASSLSDDFKQSLISRLEDDFLNGILGPALLNPNESDCARTLDYVAECLSLVTATLFHSSFFTFLIGDFDTLETPQESNEHIIRRTIFQRVMSQNERLSLSALNFVRKLVELNDFRILNNLLLRNLAPRFHLKPTQQNAITEDTKDSIGRFFTIIPVFEFGLNLEGWDSYIDESRTLISQNRNALLAFESVISQKFVINKGGKDLTSDSKSTTSNLNDSIDESEALRLWNDGGSFYSSLIKKTEKFAENSTSINITLTSIWSRLFSSPLPIVHLFLLDSGLDVRYGVKTLFNTLMKVGIAMEQRSSQILNFKESLQTVQKSFADGTSSGNDSELKRLLEAIIVLNEFIKEMIATLCLWV